MINAASNTERIHRMNGQEMKLQATQRVRSAMDLFVLLNQLTQLVGIGTFELRDNLAILRENEGGHGFNTKLSADIISVIHIDLFDESLPASSGHTRYDSRNLTYLVEMDISMRLRQLLIQRCDSTAWATPISEEIHHGKASSGDGTVVGRQVAQFRGHFSRE